MNTYVPFANTGQPWSTHDAQTASIVFWMTPNFPRGLLSEYPAALETINQVSFSEPNWDGFGALPISVETKQNAIGAIQNILNVAPPPEINPNPNGTLSFEWGTREGNAHLEIGKTKYSFYVSPRIGPPILFEGDVASIHQLHGGLVASLLFPPTSSAGTITPLRYGSDV